MMVSVGVQPCRPAESSGWAWARWTP